MQIIKRLKEITLVLLFAKYQILTAQNPQMVKDINITTAGIPHSGKQVVVGSLLYFIKEPSEIWKTDGTAASTVLVKHIISVNGDAAIDNLTNVGGTIFFSASDGIVGQELWKTDGTDAGTVIVKDIYAGSIDSDPANFVSYSGQLVFSANTAANGIELWKSDGSAAGTVLVKDIQSGTDDSNPQSFRVVQSILYFSASTSANGYELWKTDGTTSGTVLVKDIRSGSASSSPYYLTNVSSFSINNGVLFFTADNGTNGRELWKSDGTAAGTVQVLDICSGSKGSDPRSLTNVDGTLYFAADNYSSSGYKNIELWKSDNSGTAMVKDINGISNDSSLDEYSSIIFRVVNTSIYFGADNGVNGEELWKSNGTLAGTVLVIDIFSGSISSYPSSLFSIGSTLYFSADDGTNGKELWKSNGTLAGTVIVKDINSGSGSYGPQYLINLSGSLIFGAVDVPDGTVREFWKSDGTAIGTTKISLNGSTVGASPDQPVAIGNTLYFSANDGINGTELWKTDGTAIGTLMVKDINLGSGASSPENLINISGTLFFTANNGSSGVELWKSDGTAAGTVIVKDIFTGTNQSSSPAFFCNVNGVLFFAAYHPSFGYELWKSDGTTSGTVMVKDIDEQVNSSLFDGSNLTNVNGTLFFFAKTNAGASMALYISDGTNSGTLALQGIVPSTIEIISTAAFNNSFFFSYENGSDRRLWSSASFPDAVYSLSAIDNNPYGLTPINESLFFSAKNTTDGQELWKTDGTQAGSVMVKNINSSGSSNPNQLSNVNGILYFSASDGTNGAELWKSDGTSVGTVIVKDIMLGSATSAITKITNIEGTAFFFASDGFHGRELWKSDGTVIGTVMIADINANNNNGVLPNSTIIKLGNNIFFSANDGVHGIELWKYTPCPQGFTAAPTGTITTNQIASETVITLDGSANIIPSNANVTYQSGKYIQLNNGFQTQYNVVFKAQVGGCN